MRDNIVTESACIMPKLKQRDRFERTPALLKRKLERSSYLRMETSLNEMRLHLRFARTSRDSVPTRHAYIHNDFLSMPSIPNMYDLNDHMSKLCISTHRRRK